MPVLQRKKSLSQKDMAGRKIWMQRLRKENSYHAKKRHVRKRDQESIFRWEVTEMAKDRECVTSNGKASFYASIYDDLRKAAMNCGWALGLHGSLANDMDIMAMPWTENAKPVEEMIQSLSDCFTGNPWKEHHIVPHYDKPNKRVVYTMAIFSDWYLDINVIKTW